MPLPQHPSDTVALKRFNKGDEVSMGKKFAKLIGKHTSKPQLVNMKDVKEKNYLYSKVRGCYCENREKKSTTAVWKPNISYRHIIETRLYHPNKACIVVHCYKCYNEITLREYVGDVKEALSQFSQLQGGLREVPL